MTRTLFAIGIGTGGLHQLTLEAIDALGQLDAVVVADKGEEKSDLLELRRQVLERHAPQHPTVIEVTDPTRGDDASRDRPAYEAAVRDWHAARVAAYAEHLAALPDDATVGFLVWGDPAFYDSTLRIIDALAELLPLQVRVIPGISAPQALAAAHGVPLNAIGRSIHITTGRRLIAEYSPQLGDVVVMLDGHLRCLELAERYGDLQIYWGAYLGAPHEELLAGRLGDVGDQLRRTRAALRATHGWIMDTYLLRA
ncbi:precorrin-6A synthase (deacetylating) [Epidermidibacterium keratini]|uniref:Precorrin-6A synthase (Deacetylating) n=1 Tax=Epidermidibacterium keratini TaxID=1891644 RepID=A0A7L4YLV0_9ACTN|nr:precorrin-6A synthase (deacetylating) [Epidermidibacterium keratini]QHB99852.1 precorrin-6A synthase (deacetylating) [Epidermidibacterium keratini]